MKKGKFEITNSSTYPGKMGIIVSDGSFKKDNTFISLLDKRDLKDLRDCIYEVLREDCFCGNRNNPIITKHGEKSCSGMYPPEHSQPLKEEEGECCGDCLVMGDNRIFCYTKSCPCHQEKETEKEECHCKKLGCAKNLYTYHSKEICSDKQLSDEQMEQILQEGEETPKKLPSERIAEIVAKNSTKRTMDIDIAEVWIDSVIQYLDETAKDL